MYIHHIKAGNSAICDSMDGPGGHCASEISQPQGDKHQDTLTRGSKLVRLLAVE